MAGVDALAEKPVVRRRGTEVPFTDGPLAAGLVPFVTGNGTVGAAAGREGGEGAPERSGAVETC